MKTNLANDLAREVPGAVPEGPPECGCREPLDFNEVYRLWFHEVSRWVRAFGGLDADVDDLTQEVFLVVRRKLPTFDGRSLAGWLYGISQRTVSQHRRSAWIRRFFQPPASYLEQIVDDSPDPAEEIERKDSQRALQLVLSHLSQAQRTVFILYEIEGYACEEIARLEGAPLNTVYSRLHHARKQFTKHVAKLTGGTP